MFAVNISSGTTHADVMPYAEGNAVETGYYDSDLQQVVEDREIKLEDIKISHDLILPQEDILKQRQDDFVF